MNKFLVESGWKSVEQKYKMKDTTLQQALAGYAKLEEGKYIDRVKALEHVKQVATAVKKSKEVLAAGDVGKYLGEMLKAVDAEEKQVKDDSVANAVAVGKKVAEDAKAIAAAQPPKPDPKMLEEVYQIGVNDGLNGEKSVRNVFAKALPYQKKYDEGYQWGSTITERSRAKGPQAPQTSMSPITEEQEKQNNEYTRRRANRKVFIQYMNDQWSTVLPEDM